MPRTRVSDELEDVHEINEDVNPPLDPGPNREQYEEMQTKCMELEAMLGEAGESFQDQQHTIEQQKNTIEKQEATIQMLNNRMKELEIVAHTRPETMNLQSHSVASRTPSPSRIQLTNGTQRMLANVPMSSTVIDGNHVVGQFNDITISVGRPNIEITSPRTPRTTSGPPSPGLSPINPTPPYATSRKNRRKRAPVKANKAILLKMSSSPSVRKSTVDRFFGFKRAKTTMTPLRSSDINK